MDTWHQCNLRAHTEFQLAFYDNALQLHQQALDYAHDHFADYANVCVHHAFVRVLTSYFGLADCHKGLQHFALAAECYVAAQRFLADSSHRLPATPRIEHEIQHAQSHLHALWCDLVEQHEGEIAGGSLLAYQQGRQQLMHYGDADKVLH
ncbi:MAG TPA: hypothetical protein VMH83_00450 [Candidatus Acidoferrum sp.]|nr:hypothetical protein [Candidatus Acidoferrum sp.]